MIQDIIVAIFEFFFNVVKFLCKPLVSLFCWVFRLSPKKQECNLSEEDEEAEEIKYNVGEACIIISYLDENDKLQKHEGYIYGTTCNYEDLDPDYEYKLKFITKVEIISAYTKAVEYIDKCAETHIYLMQEGKITLCIPAHRVKQATIHISDHWKTHEKF